MTDRVHPSTKPHTAAKPSAPPPLPITPSKSHPHRPIPTTPRRHNKTTPKFNRRRCCFLTCLYTILLLLLTILAAFLASSAFYALYHPRRPQFSVTSLKISSFNLTTLPSDDSTHLTAKINLTLSAKNPNKKQILFSYDQSSISVLSSSITLANSSFAAFNSSAGAISVIHTAMPPRAQLLDADSVNSIESDLKRLGGLPIRIVVDTTVAVKMDKIKVRRFGIIVTCDGIRGFVPRGKTVIPAKTTDAVCEVDLRIKILRWSF